MNQSQISIHEKAISCARRFNHCEGELLKSLEEVERAQVYFLLGMKSLFQYCLEALHLTESQASAMIGVMRKAKVIPALKEAIERGDMNVSRAKRIVSVMNVGNAEVWIGKAQKLNQRELELEIVRENPKLPLPERISPISAERSEVRFTVTSELESKLNRAKEILNSASFEDTLEKLTTLFLEKNDPFHKKMRSLRIAPRPLQRSIPRSIRNRVLIRDKGQCIHREPNGVRCNSRKWVNVHHLHAFSQGGDHSLQNLATLCYGHHRLIHFQEDQKSDPSFAKQRSE